MKQDRELRNNIKQIRTRLGLSQQDLAQVAGVSRQAISGVESGQYAPSATVALRLAKALGCRVEDLFWLDNDETMIEAFPTSTVPIAQPFRLTLAQVGSKLIAYPLIKDDAFRTEIIAADGEGWRDTEDSTIKVKLWREPEVLNHTVVIAGCTPVLSLWANVAQRWYPDLRVYWSFANSMDALHRLARGEVHIAGVHLYDPASNSYNESFAKKVLSNHSAVLINLGIWEEGLLVQPGNPKQIKTITQLADSHLKIINRESGSGSRQLLEHLLQEAQISPTQVQGFDQIVNSHVAVAQAIASGAVDAGVSTRALATAFELEFIPLQKTRYDLVTFEEYLQHPPVQQMLNILGHHRLHSQLVALGGYDTSQTGEIVARID
ncbi:transcriptional regulator of molybdate metabolism, XRE family [Gloeothece citriformis PCC 7424]|uniref:Transcriptional regulator of molybdate metabolism, XRE family n=1 Tax=Gloeothece citriformis (strain PCC 7424) TaxID=65393 RepID=B7KBZ1_GLOC7|nr:substrate-binding domain-containing protein [Gloeothece citriformis]ACK68814.1 transcriptional regulator of molybdate metabolism, XRE family [Gloeothece citriformis PCC 7424]